MIISSFRKEDFSKNETLGLQANKNGITAVLEYHGTIP